ncbi:hypothetical protein HUJ04_011914 [Dendroctonus ponderosae]|nr:hypothetical protein HUJ04_011914 [Dendroctonus ponderosae]
MKELPVFTNSGKDRKQINGTNIWLIGRTLHRNLCATRSVWKIAARWSYMRFFPRFCSLFLCICAKVSSMVSSEACSELRRTA